MTHEARSVNTGLYHSRSLGREQPYAWILPEDSKKGESQPVPLLILLHGYKSDHLGWTTYTRLARYAVKHNVCIAFPEGSHGWYTDAYDGSSAFESDLIQDFLPHLQRELPLKPPGRNWAIGGLSMGGYGAVKIGLKYPELFSHAISYSGAFDITRSPKPHPVFGDIEGDRAFRRANSVYSLAEDALSRWPTERPQLYIGCGTEDDLIRSSRAFHDHLKFIGYQHTYQEMPGHHTWPYWDRAIRTGLPDIVDLISNKDQCATSE